MEVKLIKMYPWILQMRKISEALGIKEIPWQKIFAALYVQLIGDN